MLTSFYWWQRDQRALWDAQETGEDVGERPFAYRCGHVSQTDRLHLGHASRHIGAAWQSPVRCKTRCNHPLTTLPGVSSVKPYSPAQGHVGKDAHCTMNSSSCGEKEVAPQMCRLNVTCNMTLLYFKKQIGEQHAEHELAFVRTKFLICIEKGLEE